MSLFIVKCEINLSCLYFKMWFFWREFPYFCVGNVCEMLSHVVQSRVGGSGSIRLNERQQKDHTMFLVNYLSVVTTQKSSRKGDYTTRKKMVFLHSTAELACSES